MSNFDRNAAAAYASRYAITPNVAYPPYENDCTSFVSQAMLAGGWTMIGGSVFDRKGDGVWWYGESSWSRASYTWGGAHNFSKFIAQSGRGKICPRNDLVVGDVVQIVNGTHVFHTMIVTTLVCSADGDGPHMSYHTNNTINKFLGKIEAGYPSANGFSFLYWKVLDVY